MEIEDHIFWHFAGAAWLLFATFYYFGAGWRVGEGISVRYARTRARLTAVISIGRYYTYPIRRYIVFFPQQTGGENG